MKLTISTLVLIGSLISGATTTIAQYKQKNLVSDEKGARDPTHAKLFLWWDRQLRSGLTRKEQKGRR